MKAARFKILHIVSGRCNPDSANGVDKTIYYLSRAQAALGHEVHLLSVSEKEPVEIPGVAVHRVDSWRNFLTISAEVRKTVAEIAPDVGHFHSNYIPNNVGLARHFRSTGIPYVVTPNGNCSKRLMRRRPWLKIPYKVLFERPYINGSIYVHSVGDGDEIKDYGITVPLVDAPNGIDVGEIPPAREKNAILETYPGWEGRKLLLFIGRLDRQQKGLDLLLEALAGLDGEQDKLAVLLVGPDWQGQRAVLEGQVAELGLGDVVRFHGPAFGNDKFDLLRSADCFLHPSRWEGMPFSVIEAMASELLCLVAPAADPGGWLARDDTGVVVDCEPGAIREGIVRVLAMEASERARLIAGARQQVSDHFDWNSIAGTITAAYAQHGASGSISV